jgi:hypothetical protein
MKYEMPPLAMDIVEEEDEAPAVDLLPDRYADGKASGLAATITKDGPNTFEFQREWRIGRVRQLFTKWALPSRSGYKTENP